MIQTTKLPALSGTAAVSSGTPADGLPMERTVIRPSSAWQLVDLRQLWHYRELLFFLAWRDIMVRYKQTVLGVAWVILQPLLAMTVFTVLFGRLAKLDQHTGGIPYSLYTLCALIPWQMFTHALTESSSSLVQEKRLLTKVYFPRVIIPTAPVLSSLVDVSLALLFLLAMMSWHGVWLGWTAAAVPLFLGLALLTSLAAGLWLSALNALYRDVKYVVPFLTQFWMFLTPIAYPSSIVPEEWRVWYALNPLVGVVDGFRWALLGAEAPSALLMSVSTAAVLALFAGGLIFFRRIERTIADVV
jgi:lipopolysaccharide transport system permease protein